MIPENVNKYKKKKKKGKKTFLKFFCFSCIINVLYFTKYGKKIFCNNLIKTSTVKKDHFPNKKVIQFNYINTIM